MSAQPALAMSPRTTLSVVAQTREDTDAVLAFNGRMRAAKAPVDFLLPDQPNNSHTLGTPPQAIEWTKFVVVDNDDEVRGGFLLMTQPAWLNGAIVEVANYQAPLSEGIVDPRYGMVGMHMLRYVEKHWPLTFAIGMGGMDRPLPRLLQAAGWHVRAVPFLFHVVRASRVLRELRLFQERTSLRLAARGGTHRRGRDWRRGAPASRVDVRPRCARGSSGTDRTMGRLGRSVVGAHARHSNLLRSARSRSARSALSTQ